MTTLPQTMVTPLRNKHLLDRKKEIRRKVEEKNGPIDVKMVLHGFVHKKINESGQPVKNQ